MRVFRLPFPFTIAEQKPLRFVAGCSGSAIIGRSHLLCRAFSRPRTIDRMRYRLRTLMVLMAVLPPAIGIVASYVGQSANLWQVKDPLLWLGAIAWVVVFMRFVLFRPEPETP